MRRSMLLCALALGLVFSATACGDDDGTTPDAGTADQAVTMDKGPNDDTGPGPDATPVADSAPAADSTPAADSGGGQSCTTCHAMPPAKGRHNKHKGFSCATCHSEVVDAQNNIISTTLHKNGSVNVKGSFTWDGNAKSCAGASCHGTETW